MNGLRWFSLLYFYNVQIVLLAIASMQSVTFLLTFFTILLQVLIILSSNLFSVASLQKSGCGDCLGSEGDDDACTVLRSDP